MKSSKYSLWTKAAFFSFKKLILGILKPSISNILLSEKMLTGLRVKFSDAYTASCQWIMFAFHSLDFQCWYPLCVFFNHFLLYKNSFVIYLKWKDRMKILVLDISSFSMMKTSFIKYIKGNISEGRNYSIFSCDKLIIRLSSSVCLWGDSHFSENR